MPTDTGASPGSTPPPSSGRSGPRRLVRFPHDGPLGGVCAGVADYLDIDPNIVRIAAVVLAVTGPGLPAYLLAWVFVPAADGSVLAPWPRRGRHRSDHGSQVLGIVAIAIAISVLWGDWWRPAHGWFVPFGLIVGGAWLLLRNRDEDDARPPDPGVPGGPGGGSSPWRPMPPTAPVSVTPAPFPPAGVTEPTSGPSSPDPTASDGTATDPTATDPTDRGATDLTEPLATTGEPSTDHPTATSVLPETMSSGPTPPNGPESPGWAAATDPRHPGHNRNRRPRRRRVLGPIVFGALLLWGGIAWLVGVSAQDGLAVGLCIVGAGFVIGAFVGGSKVLILPALVITAALIVASTVDIPISSGIGDRTWHIVALGDLDRSYALGIGDATLDLGDLPLAATTRLDLAVKVGIGHLTVDVPDTASVTVTTKVGAGDSELFDHQQSGSSVTTTRSVKGTTDGGVIHLDLRLGVGQVTVRRVAATTTSDSSDLSTQTTAPTPTTPPTPTSTPVPTTPAVAVS